MISRYDFVHSENFGTVKSTVEMSGRYLPSPYTSLIFHVSDFPFFELIPPGTLVPAVIASSGRTVKDDDMSKKNSGKMRRSQQR